MSNLAILPIIMPLVFGIVLAFFPKKVPLVRSLAKVFTAVSFGFSIYLMYVVLNHGSLILNTGGWEAPYAIVIVADSLSVLLVLTTNLVALACIFYAPSSLTNKQEEYYFYTFYFLMISGVCGAFLTGDLFNLFVFFEVLLMASYALIVLGGNKAQLRESIKYALINLFSSILFVTTISFLYSVVGTINMAQIAVRVQEVEQTGVLTTIGVLLFFVFATKAALFPLYYWMPSPYTKPNPVVSALFGALLTKVGIYAILRVFTLIFIGNVNLTHQLFIWIAAFTLVFGAIGALSTSNIKLIVAYNIIPAVGFMMLGIGVFNELAIAGTIYYLVTDMIIKAALFLLAGAIAYLAGTSDLRKMSGLINQYPLLGWLLFISAFILAGIPPFSGFIGKIAILQGSIETGEVAVVIIGLLTSLLMLLSIIRIFINGFWGEKDETIIADKQAARRFSYPIAFLLAFPVILGLGAEFFYPTVENISQYLMDPDLYIKSVLKE